MDIKDYQYVKTGAIIGLAQTIIGHPLDTLKTNYQNNLSSTSNLTLINNLSSTNNFSFQNIFKSNTSIIKRLYAGIYYPATINLVYNTCVYQLHHNLHQNSYSHFSSGCISGGIMGIILNPFEYKKVLHQVKDNSNSYYTQNKINHSKIKFPYLNTSNLTNNYNPIFVGLKYTILRESLSTGIYFSTYFYFKDEKKVSVFQSGGLAGIYSWLFTYPIDTYKTRVQVNLNYSMNLFKNIEKNNRSFIYFINNVNITPITSLWSGLMFCLARAYIVNGIGFTIYNHLTNEN